VIARLEIPVALETAEIPPYPITEASAAATILRIRSSKKGAKYSNLFLTASLLIQ
jgi:hypothetical protein